MNKYSRSTYSLVVALLLFSVIGVAQPPLPLPGGDADTTPPGQVTNLEITRVGANSVALKWVAPGDEDVASYKMYYSTEQFGERQSAQGSVATTITSGEITGLVSNTGYYVSVTAIDGDDNEGKMFVPALSFATPARAIVYEQFSATFSEADKTGTVRVGITDLPASGKKVVLNMSFVGNNEVDGMDPFFVESKVTIDRASTTDGLVNATFRIPNDEQGLGDRTYLLVATVMNTTAGRDERFDAAPPVSLKVVIEDDEVEPAIDLRNETGIELLEGTSASFEVKLSREPTDDVFLFVESTNDKLAQITSPYYLQFGRSNWDTYQNVNFRAPEDRIAYTDRQVPIAITIVEGDSAPEYIDRATNRQVLINFKGNDGDRDGDGLLDADDAKPDDPFNQEWRPAKFKHEFTANGTNLTLSWKGQSDDRIESYILWEFSEPTAVYTVMASDVESNEFQTTIDYSGGVHRYAVQAILSHQAAEYSREYAVSLGQVLFPEGLYDETCTVTSPDLDKDGICDKFEALLGTSKYDADSDYDGYDDYQEVFDDKTDPTDADSHRTTFGQLFSNPWLIVGIVLFAGLVVLVVIAARRR